MYFTYVLKKTKHSERSHNEVSVISLLGLCPVLSVYVNVKNGSGPLSIFYSLANIKNLFMAISGILQLIKIE